MKLRGPDLELLERRAARLLPRAHHPVVEPVGQLPARRGVSVVVSCGRHVPAASGLMEPEDARQVRELLNYEDNSAGGLMTTEPIMVGPEATVA